MVSTAYMHPGDNVCYVELIEGARSQDLVSFIRTLVDYPTFGPGWRLIVDQRRSGTLAGRSLQGAGEMYRAARRLGRNVRIAVVYDRSKPIIRADVIRISADLGKDELQTFDNMRDAFDWLALPEDFDLRAGEVRAAH